MPTQPRPISATSRPCVPSGRLASRAICEAPVARVGSAKRALEELVDRPAAVPGEEARPRAGEVRMLDRRRRGRLEAVAPPHGPAVLLLVEDEQRLVAELRELGAPAGAALDGAVGEDLADDVDLLAAVHLVPDALQDPL